MQCLLVAYLKSLALAVPKAAPPKTKTPQTQLSHGTLVEQPLPRKSVHHHPTKLGRACEWPEWATHGIIAWRGRPIAGVAQVS